MSMNRDFRLCEMRPTKAGYRYISLLLALVGCGQSLRAAPIVITFEGLNDADSVTTQFPGLTFSNAMVLTAGISLDEFEFPPHSGSNVVFDAGGPITLTFAEPVLSFGAYLTYSVTLTMDAFDAGSNLVSSTTSAFSSNLAISGGPGSSPNEFLEVTRASGISSVTIGGDPGGGSFVLDDATITPSPATQGVPEPGMLCLFPLAAISLAAFLRRSESR